MRKQLTGRDLAAERVRYGLRQHEIGKAMGITGQRVAALETQWRPSDRMAKRYIDALRAVTTAKHIETYTLDGE